MYQRCLYPVLTHTNGVVGHHICLWLVASMPMKMTDAPRNRSRRFVVLLREAVQVPWGVPQHCKDYPDNRLLTGYPDKQQMESYNPMRLCRGTQMVGAR